VSNEPRPPRSPEPDRCRLLFAGRLERRKGADVLVEALSGLDAVAWRLVIAGPVMRDVALEHAEFLADPRVTVLGTISRPSLAREMEAAPVFVFPSYAEGSARAVFEALACRCYVITTPNSGTIVQDGVHGALIPPGDATALAEAIVDAARDPDRTAAIGNRNGDVVRERYRQSHYGNALIDLYDELRPLD
jgi:glycosyltransferase involved in cell wall biosynthesis